MQWKIDSSHTDAAFAVKHLMISTVRGNFKNITGTINYDPSNPAASSVEAIIDATTVNTGDVNRDNHLKSPDFFNVAVHPNLTFNSTKLELKNNNEGTLTGDLTIAGVTRPVTLKVEFIGQTKTPFGDERIGFSAETKINREDFGLKWNQALETGGFLVGQEVKITLEIEAILVNQPATV